MSCANGCSGRGTCEFVQEIAQDFDDRRNGPGSRYKDLRCTTQLGSHSSKLGAQSTTDGTCAPTQRNYQAQPSFQGWGLEATKMLVSGLHHSNAEMSAGGHIYNEWDAEKIQVCKCDLGYKGSDCSQREVPKGDDPLTTVQSASMKQGIQITGTITGGEFFIKYHDPYGGVWRSDTVRFTSTHDTQSVGVGDGSDATDGRLAGYVEMALRQLPNGAMEGVKVSAIPSGLENKLCHRFFDGVQHFSAHDDFRQGSSYNAKGIPNWCLNDQGVGQAKFVASTTSIDLEVTFGQSSGQSGVQYLLEVDIAEHGPGSFPVSKGVLGTNVAVSVAEINYNENLANLSELGECAGRGLDDGEGQCDCFDGYFGVACEEQEALM